MLSGERRGSGDLLSGGGAVSASSSGIFSDQAITWRARTEASEGKTSPEELLAAAHAACYSMALSHALGGAGYTPESLEVTAAVTFVPGTGVTGSHLLLVATIPGIDEEQFHQFAEEAKAGCPISQALAGVPITLEASLR